MAAKDIELIDKCFQESKYLTAWDESVFTWDVPSRNSFSGYETKSAEFTSTVIKHKWYLESYPRNYDDVSISLVLVSSPMQSVFCVFSISVTCINGGQRQQLPTQKHCFEIKDDKRKKTVSCRLHGISSSSKLKAVLNLRTEVEKTWNTDSALFSMLGVKNPNNGLSEDMLKIFNAGSFSDVTIKVDDTKIAAHQVVLSARSPVFESMFEHDMVEKQTRSVSIEDFEKDIVTSLLVFMYTGRTPNFTSESALELLKAAEKYQVLTLKSLCEVYLIRILNTTNVVQILYLADMYRAERLKDRAVQFIGKNLECFADHSKFSLLDSRPELMRMVIGEVARAITTSKKN